MKHIDKLMNIVNIIASHEGLLKSSDVDDIEGVNSLIIGKFKTAILTSECFNELKGQNHYIDMMYDTDDTNEIYVFV